jgi:hypothetical protein
MALDGLGIGENGREVKHCVLRIRLQHEVELAAVPALEPLFEPQSFEDFRRC